MILMTTFNKEIYQSGKYHFEQPGYQIPLCGKILGINIGEQANLKQLEGKILTTELRTCIDTTDYK